MKLSELREIMDMLNPNCDVVVLKPNTPSNKIPMGFHIEPDKKEDTNNESTDCG